LIFWMTTGKRRTKITTITSLERVLNSVSFVLSFKA